MTVDLTVSEINRLIKCLETQPSEIYYDTYTEGLDDTILNKLMITLTEDKID